MRSPERLTHEIKGHNDNDSLEINETQTTQSGGAIVPPERLLINEMGALSLGETVLSAISKEELEEKTEVSKAESNYVH